MNLAFGKNLKALRHQKDMTQDELAHKLSLSVQAISRYETGTAYPDIEMLPVIAGFFGVTVDALLGVSGKAREQRMDEYTEKLRTITDRRERLALLRKQHAEFPEDWGVVSSMVYEMTFIPECLAEMREIVDDAMKSCSETIWRENIIFSYLKSESDENMANTFMDKHASRYDMRKIQLLNHRYAVRNDPEKLAAVRQKLYLEELEHSLFRITERIDGDTPASRENCRHVLAFTEHLSGNADPTKPDMWITLRLMVMLRLANNCFTLDYEDEGFAVLQDAVTLFENFFALPDGSVLTYGSPLFDRLSAVTKKEVFYGITEFTGMIAESMMVNLVYQTPISHVTEGNLFGDMEGFTRTMVFSDHTYKHVLKNAGWDGLAKVKDDPRYIALRERAKAVSSIENPENLLFMLESQSQRSDAYIQNMKWVCALLVRDVGAYVIFDDADDIEEKFTRMRREGNTIVYRTATAKFGGGFIPLPDNIRRNLLELNPDNADAEVVMRKQDGEIVYSDFPKN